jgi:hypothetical protein
MPDTAPSIRRRTYRQDDRQATARAGTAGPPVALRRQRGTDKGGEISKRWVLPE